MTNPATGGQPRVEERKRCSGCGEIKPLDEFNRDNEKKADGSLVRKDGRKRECRVCARARVRRWSTANPERDRQRGDKTQNSPQGKTRTKARKAVQSAIRRGDLKRPTACEKCGEKGEVHGHHDDYSKPLDVRWLCRECHAARHRELNLERA